jgi:periplasmic copper chaperone A
MRYAVAICAVIAALVSGMVDNAHPGQMGPGENTIQIENAWARRAPAMAQEGSGSQSGGTARLGNGAVYVTVSNHGSEPDALVSATTNVASMVELHETMDMGGKMMMQPRPKIDLPAGGKLEMKPGGYHLMLLGLTRDLKPGDTVTVALQFETAGEMRIQAPVR